MIPFLVLNTNIYKCFLDRTLAYALLLLHSHGLPYLIENCTHRSYYTLPIIPASIHSSSHALRSTIASTSCEGRDYHDSANTYLCLYPHTMPSTLPASFFSQLSPHFVLSFRSYIHTTNFNFARLSLWPLDRINETRP